MDNARAFKLLEDYKDYLTLQQYRTFRGQIRSGEADGAIKGLEKTLTRVRQKSESGMYDRCEECKWFKIHRHQKCSCCRENKKLKTRFEF